MAQDQASMMMRYRKSSVNIFQVLRTLIAMYSLTGIKFVVHHLKLLLFYSIFNIFFSENGATKWARFH